MSKRVCREGADLAEDEVCIVFASGGIDGWIRGPHYHVKGRELPPIDKFVGPLLEDIPKRQLKEGHPV